MLVKIKAQVTRTDIMVSQFNDNPKTVDEAVERLLATLSEDELQQIANTSENDLFMLHFGLGQNIRNSFGLWQGNQALLDSCETFDADDASSKIIEKLWKRLQSK